AESHSQYWNQKNAQNVRIFHPVYGWWQALPALTSKAGKCTKMQGIFGMPEILLKFLSILSTKNHQSVDVMG
ncbi:MAG: hypothetical protein V1740_07995, partial [Candidatus Woesearchaeota archaeon]